jgi:allantoin racemase
MKILIINPNTSKEVTQQIEESVKPFKRVDVELDVINPVRGPPGIESYYHKAIAAVETIKLTENAEKNRYDAEASILLAASLGHRFSIIAILKNSIPRAERLVGQLGLTQKLASIREIGMGVVEMEKEKERGWKRILERCRTAINIDGAEVIVLGCAGMSGLAQKLQRELGVPVIDPTLAAYKIAEVLIDMGLTHSKIALYKGPTVK